MVDYDMHVHSTASDGLFNVEKIISTAVRLGLKGISITDHDTISAIKEAASLAIVNKIEFIPGLELSTDYNGVEVHMLGYYIRDDYEPLNQFLREFQQSRRNRALAIIDRLQQQGYHITYDEVLKEAGIKRESIGRPHIARVLINKGYFSNIKDVFNELLGYGKPAYVERFKVNVEHGIKLITEAQGIPVLAHPVLIREYNEHENFEDFLRYLINLGLKGIEVYHSLQSEEDSKLLYSLARKYNLVITGGSDCHGKIEEGQLLLGTKGIMHDDFMRLIQLKG